jgi:hypothetical protein
MAHNLTELLRRLARLGAMRRIQDLQTEAEDILRQFPDLRRGNRAAAEPQPQSERPARARKRIRQPMTAAQRRAVGERMKKYWAERRKAAGKK